MRIIILIFAIDYDEKANFRKGVKGLSARVSIAKSKAQVNASARSGGSIRG